MHWPQVLQCGVGCFVPSIFDDLARWGVQRVAVCVHAGLHWGKRRYMQSMPNGDIQGHIRSRGLHSVSRRNRIQCSRFGKFEWLLVLPGGDVFHCRELRVQVVPVRVHCKAWVGRVRGVQAWLLHVSDARHVPCMPSGDLRRVCTERRPKLVHSVLPWTSVECHQRHVVDCVRAVQGWHDIAGRVCLVYALRPGILLTRGHC